MMLLARTCAHLAPGDGTAVFIGRKLCMVAPHYVPYVTELARANVEYAALPGYMIDWHPRAFDPIIDAPKR